MDLENALWLLTGLAAVVVLLTHLRLSSTTAQAGHAQISQTVVRAHTIVGVLAIAAWVTYLSSVNGLAGYGALLLWWIEVLLGIGILSRWLPGGGRHTTDAAEDSWASGPGLSILGHVGMLLGVCFFSWTVLTGQLT